MNRLKFNESKIVNQPENNSTRYEIWKNIIPENNNFIFTKKCYVSQLDKLNYINQYCYFKDDKLGSGFYGTVYKVYNENTEKFYACKCFKRNLLNRKVNLNGKWVAISDLIDKEVMAAKLMRNENCVMAYEVIDDKNTDQIYLIMELCDEELCQFDETNFRFKNDKYLIKDNLKSFKNRIYGLKEVNEEFLKVIFRGALEGLMYIHRLNLAHCDLKPQNIMLKDNMVKITDFGSLAYVNPNDPTKCTFDNGYGTEYFLPPEAKEFKQYNRQKADVWALGMTFFCITFGYLPLDYEIASHQVVLVPKNYYLRWSLVESQYSFSNEYKEFIEYMMNSNSIYRPSVFNIYNHSYIIKNEKKPIYNLCQSIDDIESEPTTDKIKKISEISLLDHNFEFSLYNLNMVFYKLYGMKIEDNGYDFSVNGSSDEQQNEKSIMSDKSVSSTNKILSQKHDSTKDVSIKGYNNREKQSFVKSYTFTFNEGEQSYYQSLNNEFNCSFNASYVSIMDNVPVNTPLTIVKDKVYVKTLTKTYEVTNDSELNHVGQIPKKKSSFSNKSSIKSNISSMSKNSVKNAFEKNAIEKENNNHHPNIHSENSVVLNQFSLNNFTQSLIQSYNNSIISQTTSNKRRNSAVSKLEVSLNKIKQVLGDRIQKTPTSFYRDHITYKISYALERKQNSIFYNKEQRQNLRRWSDSKLLDYIELTNIYNSKDMVLYELLETIDLINIDINNNKNFDISVDESFDLSCDNSFDIDEMLENMN